MLVQDVEVRGLEIELRQQAHYWRAQHARAAERGAAWKDKAQRLEQVVRGQQAQIAELTHKLEEALARIAWLEGQVFGRKSEQCPRPDPDADDSIPALDHNADATDEHESCKEPRRKRGKQPGAKGYGRKRRQDLPAEEVVHDLPEDLRQCPRCGKPFEVFPGTEDSEQIEWKVVLSRRIHKRSRYVPTCDCRAVTGIVTAPCPPKLIPKGMFATSFWVRLLMEKFLFQRPLHRVRKVLALEGLCVSQGTLTGGLQRIGELLQPVYTRILERSRTANHWKMDETRWLVFEEVEGKEGYRWWLWVVITDDTVAFLLEPTRSAQVPRDHLGEDPAGIINADRYSVYKALGDHILVAFCWAHVRRDFIRVRDGYRRLRNWGESWVTRINELFALNDRRLAVLSNPEAFQERDRVLRDAIDAMAKQRNRELEDPDLRKPARKALESLRNHWEGCILFVDHPEIPMDNNESERRLRDPAVGRKNYYGSGSVWSGALTAICFTIFQTLLKNSLDPKKWFSAYFEACAENGGRVPENLDEFMPWNLSEQQKEAWRCPEPFT
ncbi:MAG: IS66 family transposase [Phycisphaerae bacterium]